jgi:hypothetical protein
MIGLAVILLKYCSIGTQVKVFRIFEGHLADFVNRVNLLRKFSRGGEVHFLSKNYLRLQVFKLEKEQYYD